MPTIKQKLAFQEVLKAIENRENLNWKAIMKRAGYKDSTTTKVKDLTDSKGFRELLNMISDEAILARFYEILMDSDKRAALEAGKELLKLKDRYPDKKVKLGVFEERQDVFE